MRASTVVLLCSLLAFALAGCASRPVAATQQPGLVVFLVRHGEKVDRSSDAELSDAGRARALALAKTLRSARIQYVHSSDYMRTRATAAPAAAAAGVEAQLYDPRDLTGLVERLRATGGRHLVVGHSDTTPAAVRLLGGVPGEPIDEAREFDRLYVVVLGGDGRDPRSATSVLLRYGAAFERFSP